MVTLDFQICLSDCCKQLDILDITNYYSPDNLGGWGTPNTELANIVDATLEIISPDNILYSFDILTEVQAEDYITILPTALGYTESIPDGVYRFYVRINIGTAEAPIYITYEETKLFYCNVQNKFKNLVGTIDPCKKVCCGKNPFDDVLLIWTYMLALENAACCGKIDKFEKLLETINRLLNSKPCKNC